MKTKHVLLIVFGLSLIACKADKKAELNQLKTQREALNEKINRLEGEIASADSGKTGSGKLVSVMEIKKGVFNHFIEVQGSLDGDGNIAATSTMGGIVKAIYVKEGDRVKKDQLLVEVDHDAVSAQLKAAESNLNLVTEMFKKQNALWEQKIGSEVQYLTAKTNKEALENQVKALREQADMSCVKAPIDGTIEDLPVRIGQMLAPGITNIRVINLAKFKVVAQVAEGYSARIKEGDVVRVFFPDLDKEFMARVDFSSRYINPINRTFMVEAHIQGDVPGLKANMIAMMRIVDYSNENALSVPVNYIQNDGRGDYIMVSENKKAVKRNVTLGQIYNGMAEIRQGVKEGDLIVTAGYLDLEEGNHLSF